MWYAQIVYHILWNFQDVYGMISGIATGGSRRVPPLTVKNFPKIWKKEGEIQEKLGKKRKNQEEKAKIRKFFHFAPPDR